MKKFYTISFFIIIIDRIIKILVQNFLTGSEFYLIKNFFYLTYVKNDGAAFSLFGGMQVVLALIGVLTAFIIIYYVKKNNIKNIGYSLLLGGVISNIIDRVFLGFVIDYLGFILFNRYMPIFNFADIMIVLGAFFIIVGSDKNEIDSGRTS